MTAHDAPYTVRLAQDAREAVGHKGQIMHGLRDTGRHDELQIAELMDATR